VDDGPSFAPDDPNRASHERVRQRFRDLRTSGDQSIRDELILEHRWIAEQCSRRFRHRGEPDADLIQIAWLGLVKSVDRYDPERDVPFHGYAIPTILGELKRHFRDATWSVGVSRSTKDLQPRLRVATEALHHRLGRSPTVDELADEMGVGREIITAALAARAANQTVSLSRLDVEARGRPSDIQVQAGGYALAEVDARLTALGALRHLDERSRTILVWRFYEELTQREIGERLGIGQVQVSRLLRRALERMRTRSIN
jgi:RNA polymerase sigma-B factor